MIHWKRGPSESGLREGPKCWEHLPLMETRSNEGKVKSNE